MPFSQMLGAGALGWPREMVWGGRWEGDSGVGTHVHSWQIHVDVWQNQSVQFSLVQSLSRVQLFAIPWIAAHQASLSITISRSSLRLTSIESVMPSSHLTLGRPLLLLPQIPPSIRVFSNESTLRMRWPKYWSFSLSINPSNEYPGLISFCRILFELNWNFSSCRKLFS